MQASIFGAYDTFVAEPFQNLRHYKFHESREKLPECEHSQKLFLHDSTAPYQVNTLK